MKDYYGFDDCSFDALVAAGVTTMDLFKSADFFNPNKTDANLSKVNLYYYIDAKGDFNAPPTKARHKLIAKALYESLNLTMAEKLQILSYIEFAEDGYKN